MLKTTLDTLDDVPEAIKPYYSERDGKYVLQIADVDLHPDVANLRNAYQAEKAKRRERDEELTSLRERLKAIPDDFDPQAWEKSKGKPDGDLLKIRASLEAENEALKKQIAARDQKLYEVTVELALDEFLAKNGVSEPAYQKAARTLLKPSIKQDEKGNPFVETDMGPIGVEDYVSRWLAGEGKAFVSNPKGTGAEGGNDKALGHGAGSMAGTPEERRRAIAAKYNVPAS